MSISQKVKDVALFVTVTLISVALFVGGIPVAQMPGWERAGTGMVLLATFVGAFLIGVTGMLAFGPLRKEWAAAAAR